MRYQTAEFAVGQAPHSGQVTSIGGNGKLARRKCLIVGGNTGTIAPQEKRGQVTVAVSDSDRFVKLSLH